MLLIPPSLSRLAAQKLAAIGQKFRSDDDDDRNNGMMTMHVNRTHFLNETFVAIGSVAIAAVRTT